jgi:TRAP-type transport system periplasmic protein
MRVPWYGIALVALLCAGMPQRSAAATNLVRIAVPWSPGSKGLADLQAAARDISKQTAGRVQVKFVEQHDLDSGKMPCEGAMLVGPILVRYSPAALVYALPLLFRSSAEVARVRAQMDAEVAAELDARGFATIAQMDLGFAYIHSRAPVETVAQLQAARLWVPPTEPVSIRLAESYGVTLVPLEAPRVREALRNGTVDAAIVPPLGAILLQWHTEIKNVADTPFLCLYAAAVLRKDALAALEGPDQTVLRDGLGRAFSAAADDLRGKESESLDVLAQNGVVRHPLGATPEQRNEWEAWATTVADRLVAEGRIPAGLVEQARQTLSDFRAQP